MTPWSKALLEKLSRSAAQEIPCLLWFLKIHYRVHKIPALGPIVSRIPLL